MAEEGNTTLRAFHIKLDYFKKVDPLQRWKLRLSGLAALVCAAWLIWGMMAGDAGQLRYSRGPVASAHATWDAQCAACHTPFKPLVSSGAAALLRQERDDSRCGNCHAGPTHHAVTREGTESGCGDCHREHRGRDASLVRLEDRDCTRCHNDLAASMKEDAPATFANSVTRFAAGAHPGFRVWDPVHKRRVDSSEATDATRLRFNHKLHLTAGMALAGATPNPRANMPFTLDKIADAADRERYRKKGQAPQADNGNLVQLDCASCHQLDGTDVRLNLDRLQELPLSPLMPARAPGSHMLPITYENQCRACHPLTLSNAPGAQAITVPHRLQPDAVRLFLQRSFVARFLTGQPEALLDTIVPRRPVPGKGGEEDRSAVEKSKLRAQMERHVYDAERLLYLGKNTCGECHHFANADGSVIEKGMLTADRIKVGAAPGFRIEATAVRDIWFEHARFDHAAHRAVECRACHERAYADVPAASTRSDDVLVPGIANCLECHRSTTGWWGGGNSGGARADCTECHRYHHGDAPRAGLGADQRGARQRMPLKDFRTGNSHP